METKEIEAYVAKQIKLSPKLRSMLDEQSGKNEFPELQSFAVMGLNEEAGEVAGLACRECWKKIPMPRYKWLQELGDVLWYLTAATMAKGLTLEELWQYNVEKLEGRYGELREREG
jgi:hypothetical protein